MKEGTVFDVVARRGYAMSNPADCLTRNAFGLLMAKMQGIAKSNQVPRQGTLVVRLFASAHSSKHE